MPDNRNSKYNIINNNDDGSFGYHFSPTVESSIDSSKNMSYNQEHLSKSHVNYVDADLENFQNQEKFVSL